MKRKIAWLAYPDGVDKVYIVRRGVSDSNLLRPVNDPVLVEDEDGDRFVIGMDKLYDDPLAAAIASSELRTQYGLTENDDDDDSELVEEDEDNDDE